MEQNNYQMNFHTGDIEWLANEYKRQKNINSSLSLEDFCLIYGISADKLKFKVEEASGRYNHFITLWHGTTMSRANSILEEGFQLKKKRGQGIFFTVKRKVALEYAKKRAKREQDHPAIITCSVDLYSYNKHEWQGNEVLVFKHDHIDSDVVRRVTEIA
jgi:hypothetical protein